jgi:hypothetical protein
MTFRGLPHLPFPGRAKVGQGVALPHAPPPPSIGVWGCGGAENHPLFQVGQNSGEAGS